MLKKTYLANGFDRNHAASFLQFTGTQIFNHRADCHSNLDVVDGRMLGH